MTSRLPLCLALAGALVAFGARSAHAADTLESLVTTGPAENRIDLVITGDGYTAAQADLFRQHAQDLVVEMFAGAPLASYENVFNISLVVTESAQSGADHPSRGVEVDTYFDGTFDCGGIERLTCADYTKVATVVMGLAPETDFIVLILNDPQYGGSGGSVAIVSAHELAVDILVHELGHTISGLADEYSAPYPGYPPGDPEPNVDFDSSFDLIKWKHWIEDGTPLPTSPGDAVTAVTPIGAYVGARYLEEGIHRPAPDCGMRSLGSEYCAVCREAQIVSFYEIVAPIDGVSPAPGLEPLTVERGTAVEPMHFAVDTPALESLVIQWLVDGEPVATGPELVLDAAELELSLGSHTLEVVVGDQNPMVRVDPNALMTASQSWSLEVVQGENLPDAGAQVGDDAGPSDELTTGGCGCRAGGEGRAGTWLLGLAVLAMTARRRRRAHHAA